MLFQGQEFAASSPFVFFADHEPELAKLVRKGRADFLSQWRSLSLRGVNYDDPAARETFLRCKLDFSERQQHHEMYSLHRDLLKLRKTEPLFSRQDRQLDGEILGPEAFCLRFFSEGYRDDRLLIVNLGVELYLPVLPTPLLAPPEDMRWSVQWSTENPCYGGNGAASLEQEDCQWILPGHAAVVLRPEASSDKQRQSRE